MPSSDSKTQPHKSWPGGRANRQQVASGSSKLRTLQFGTDDEQHKELAIVHMELVINHIELAIDHVELAIVHVELVVDLYHI
eukprot:8861301-Heterocapsa_arctica.AAC.1